MNKRQIMDFLDEIEEGNSIEIRKDSSDEYQIVKGIFPTLKNENNIPQFSQNKYRSTSIVSVTTNRFEHYRDFGKKPKENNDKSSKFVIGLFLAFLKKFPVKLSKISTNYLTYDVKEVKGYKGFYNKEGNLRWVEKDEIKYFNS